jgi:hypothetical protein
MLFLAFVCLFCLFEDCGAGLFIPHRAQYFSAGFFFFLLSFALLPHGDFTLLREHQ